MTQNVQTQRRTFDRQRARIAYESTYETERSFILDTTDSNYVVRLQGDYVSAHAVYLPNKDGVLEIKSQPLDRARR
jgi:hypothetical protein